MKYKVQITRLDVMRDDINYETDSPPTYKELCERVLQRTGGWFVITVTVQAKKSVRRQHGQYFAHARPGMHRSGHVLLFKVSTDVIYSERDRAVATGKSVGSTSECTS